MRIVRRGKKVDSIRFLPQSLVVHCFVSYRTTSIQVVISTLPHFPLCRKHSRPRQTSMDKYQGCRSERVVVLDNCGQIRGVFDPQRLAQSPGGRRGSVGSGTGWKGNVRFDPEHGSPREGKGHAPAVRRSARNGVAEDASVGRKRPNCFRIGILVIHHHIVSTCIRNWNILPHAMPFKRHIDGFGVVASMNSVVTFLKDRKSSRRWNDRKNGIAVSWLIGQIPAF